MEPIDDNLTIEVIDTLVSSDKEVVELFQNIQQNYSKQIADEVDQSMSTPSTHLRHLKVCNTKLEEAFAYYATFVAAR